MRRMPAVAGMFYESQGEALSQQVSACVADVPLEEQGSLEAVGVVTPHAGYLYSGAVAGAVFARVRVPERVVLLGPNHTGLGQAASLMASGIWAMPGGDVPVDEDLARRILDRVPWVREDHWAHLQEHSLEVQIPFLQRFQPRLRITPLVLMGVRYPLCQALGQALASCIRDVQEPVLIVASSDMTHYEPQSQAQTKDRMAIQRILELDPEGLYRVVHEERISMCGYLPAVVMVVAAKALGAREARLIRYATSGDVTGDVSSVVGYAGIAVL